MTTTRRRVGLLLGIALACLTVTGCVEAPSPERSVPPVDTPQITPTESAEPAEDPTCPTDFAALPEFTLALAQHELGTDLIICTNNPEATGPRTFPFEEPWDRIIAVDGVPLPARLVIAPPHASDCVDTEFVVAVLLDGVWYRGRGASCPTFL